MASPNNPTETEEQRVYGDIWGALNETELFLEDDTVAFERLTTLMQECFEGDLSEEEPHEASELEEGEIPKKKKKKQHPRSDSPFDTRSVKDALRWAKNVASEAKANCTEYDFSLAEEMAKVKRGEKRKVFEVEMVKLPAVPCSGMDRDGKYIYISIPSTRAMTPKMETSLYNLMRNFGAFVKLKLGLGADNQGRGSKKAYTKAKGSLSGVFNLVTSWSGIGHNLDNPAPSRDMLATSATFSRSMRVMAGLNLLNVTLNEILRVVHPEGYKACKDLQEAICRAEPYAKAFRSIDNLLWEGRALIYNRTTPLHCDRRDALSSWTPIVTLGQYQGGDLGLPAIGVKLHHGPGSINFIRGALMAHEVGPWSGTEAGLQRIALAHFTHQYLWDRYGLFHPL